jgi:STE24 endopeptidase
MSLVLTIAFVVFLLAMVGLKYWLAFRQIRYVSAHANAVPPQFADRVSLDAHRRAAAYTVEKTRLGLFETAVGALLLLVMTLLGGLDWLVRGLASFGTSDFILQMLIVAVVLLAASLLDLPFAFYRQFHIEQKFGFNRMTVKLWILDLAKSLVLTALLGLPLLTAVLWLMRSAGELWWVYAWLLWVGFNALVLVLYPTLIAPLFNKFEPLKDGSLAERITALLRRTGFSSKGVFVMDGSRRSAHGNAYFTGLGRAKRIVFFDTLLARLAPDEIEAVLAHELGHFKLKHVTKRMVLTAVLSLGFLALLAWLAASPWFYEGLGVPASLERPGVALILFFLALPVFTFVLQPLSSLYSRKHEFEADAFATKNASAASMTSALVKLYEDNAATLTPDPVHSAFYDSHPPAAVRIARLAKSGPAAAASVP